MKTTFEEEYGKYTWQSWTYCSGKMRSLKQSIPCSHGVYIIRAPDELPRVHGKSSVVYIGQSGGGKQSGKQGIGAGNGCPGRLFNTHGSDKLVLDKIETLYSNQCFTVECSFTGSEDPKQVEARLLRTYLDTYYELPPANHNNPCIKEKA